LGFVSTEDIFSTNQCISFFSGRLPPVRERSTRGDYEVGRGRRIVVVEKQLLRLFTDFPHDLDWRGC